MRNTNRIRSRLLATTIIGSSLLALAAPVMAQEATPQDEEATEIEEVIVTGSRIRRDPANAPTPLIQISGEALQTTGQSTIIDYLATLPALSNSFLPSDTVGFLGVGGLALPNLRALGANRTLTLIDGRRQVGSNGGSLAVDVDTVPRLLIQNVEIITGGASSVYGADAVSGVLNFVLRKDFEGLEIDANYGMINQDGQANRRISALLGANLFDDRLNLWGFAEHEEMDLVGVEDIDWVRASYRVQGIDADPAGQPYDGHLDNALFQGARQLNRLRWGQVTLANTQPGSQTTDPDIPYATCTAANVDNPNCFAQNPGVTWIFEGPTARLANFGQRVGSTGLLRIINIGGDGENAAFFGGLTRVPESVSNRFAAGANFELTPQISGTLEAKFVDEDTFFITQPTFFDVNINNNTPATAVQPARTLARFDIRLNDNAFIPENLRLAIQNNTVTTYAPPTANSPSVATGTAPAPFARLNMFGPDRTQTNHRQLQRYVAALRGEYDRVMFINDFTWDISYVYGEAEMSNRERGVDVQRFVLGADAVRDNAGVLGTPGAIVCRSRLLLAQGLPLRDDFRGGDIRNSAEGLNAVNQCVPLNIFGQGNQSPEALAYIDAAITVRERNEQEQAIASVSGQLWDLWGAGPIGVAVGAEYRREYTEAIGRSSDTGDRTLFLNTGPDFPGVQYESEEIFAELSVPLLRDSFLGEFAELSGSYRTSDYTTVGEVEVYGVNLVYRPIQDITFKTSFNSSIRVPDLAENFRPYTQTFQNGFVDPCATANINGAALTPEIRANRIANCTAQAAAQGLVFDFAGATPNALDDFNPIYGGGIAGVNGGNPFLRPEESESFTFSTVLQPRFFPNLTLILDYYEIEITDVIAAVTAQQAANNCVSGPTINSAACATLFRNNPTIPFGLGAPAGDPIGGFIQGSVNFAALTTRGLDFTARYSLDFEEAFGRNWGRVDYTIGGLWLLEQQDFLDSTNRANFVEFAGRLGLPRTRFTSSLTYSPNDTWSINWSADWQSAQELIANSAFLADADTRPEQYRYTENFVRNDFTVRWNVDETLSLRAGVVNAFDAEQSRWLGAGAVDNFDPFGRRFFIGLNYRPF